MNRLSFSVCFYILIFVCTLTLSSVAFAKKRCKPLLNKLHNIQTMQRSGHSLKRGQSLRAKEDKARDKWWQCENSSLAAFKSKYGKVKKKLKHKTTKYKRVKSKTKRLKVSKYTLKPPKHLARFNQGSAIVIKSKYQGEKQLAWLQFYQQPIECQRPKKMKVFVYCTEDKLQQQYLFQQKYSR